MPDLGILLDRGVMEYLATLPNPTVCVTVFGEIIVACFLILC